MPPSLQQLLAAPSSPEAWAMLCDHLDALYASDPAALLAAVPICEAALAAWPPSIRLPRWSWLEALEEGTVVPMLRLIAVIEDWPMEDPALIALACSPHAANLTCLGVQNSGLSDEGIAALAVSPHISGLRSLSLFWCSVTDDGFERLVESGKLAGLEDLCLKETGISGAAVRALLERADAPALHRLAVGPIQDGTTLEDEDIVAIAACASIQQLEDLDLCYNGLYDDAACALARSPHLTRLRFLSLDKNCIGRVGALALVTSARLPALEWLGLSNNVGLEGTSFEETPEEFYTELAERYPIVTV